MRGIAGDQLRQAVFPPSLGRKSEQFPCHGDIGRAVADIAMAELSTDSGLKIFFPRKFRYFPGAVANGPRDTAADVPSLASRIRLYHRTKALGKSPNQHAQPRQPRKYPLLKTF